MKTVDKDIRASDEPLQHGERAILYSKPIARRDWYALRYTPLQDFSSPLHDEEYRLPAPRF